MAAVISSMLYTICRLIPHPLLCGRCGEGSSNNTLVRSLGNHHLPAAAAQGLVMIARRNVLEKLTIWTFATAPLLEAKRSAGSSHRWSPLEPFKASTAADRQRGGRSLRAPRRGSGTPN